MPALVAAGHRVITYDRRGFGQSSQPWDGYDDDTFAADLDALLTSLDLRGATLVGFSMGGGEVVRYLKTYGADRVAKAVLAAAVPPYLYTSDDNPDGATITSFETGVKTDRPAFLDGFATEFFSTSGLLGKTLQVSSRVGAVTVPTLVIHGDSDAVVPFEVSGKRCAELIPGARLHVVEGGPHGINASHAEEFNRVLLEFLAS